MERKRAERGRVSMRIRLADRITRFTGSMAFVYVHLSLLVDPAPDLQHEVTHPVILVEAIATKLGAEVTQSGELSQF
ncbi:MAG TPA: hypothetical protein VGK72_05380 [Chthoniobacterales bacterium]